VQRIDPGGQIQVMGEAPQAVLEAIVDQHRAYGIISVDEATKHRGFVGRIFAFDTPVDLDRINYAIDHNDGVLFDQGEKQRREMAVSIDHMLQRELRQPMRTVEVEVLEEAENPRMAEGLRVVHDHALAREGGIRAGRGSNR